MCCSRRCCLHEGCSAKLSCQCLYFIQLFSGDSRSNLSALFLSRSRSSSQRARQAPMQRTSTFHKRASELARARPAATKPFHFLLNSPKPLSAAAARRQSRARQPMTTTAHSAAVAHSKLANDSTVDEAIVCLNTRPDTHLARNGSEAPNSLSRGAQTFLRLLARSRQSQTATTTLYRVCAPANG